MSAQACRSSPHKPFEEVEMARKQTDSTAGRLTHPLLEKLGVMSAAQAEIFAYSVKIVCGKQTETNCCCVAGARPGVYATEVNIQNLNLVRAPVVKLVLPLINSGAVVARAPNLADPAAPGRAPERRDRPHHRPPHDREPGRAVRLRGLHGESTERGRDQHRRRVHSVA